ncbi:MAG TPA: hypothetical protein VFU32_05340 [Ktedonobacterales bacterium]|nr:hypothetical protein [Ktedonobacterales bacterium]
MSMPRRSIFREQALRHYRRSRDKDVLPRFVAPPVFLGFWIVLSLCLVAGGLAWNIRVPVYVAGSGVVAFSGEAQAVLFVSAEQQPRIHPGEPVQVNIGSTGPRLLRAITTVVPTLLSPEQARQRYHLDGPLSLLVAEPSVVITVALDTTLSVSAYAGSIVSAQVQVGNVSILSYLPVIGRLIGG